MFPAPMDFVVVTIMWLTPQTPLAPALFNIQYLTDQSFPL
jgi:hypothetical protein